jgi:hypothetical protein
MARRKRRRRTISGRRSQLGYNADAKEAIKYARKGKCELAMRHLVDASYFHTSDVDRDEAHLARVIVNQHCGKARTRRIKPKGGKAQKFPYWGSRKRRKRR